MSSTPNTPYTPVRRIVTGHDANGRSIIVSDGPTPNVKIHTHMPMVAQVVWATDSAPARLDQEETAPAGQAFKIGPENGGCLLRIATFPPDSECDPTVMDKMIEEMGGHQGERDTNNPRHFFFHKTLSLDYAIVLEGEIWALMDEGEAHMKQGDVLIQRGTNHSWSNRSDKTAKMLFVLLDAKE
jgi:hypothetical protein